MEQTSTTVQENKSQEVPQTFTRDSIIKLLHTKSICGAIDSYRLSELLGTISQRMIRNHTKSGQLKPLDHRSHYYIYKVEDVADWLLKYPKYLFVAKNDNSDITKERFAELSNYIRIAVTNSWKGLLERMDMEDIISEVILIILRKKRTNVSDAMLVYRALSTIWNKEKKRIVTVPLDINKLTNGDEEEY